MREIDNIRVGTGAAMTEERGAREKRRAKAVDREAPAPQRVDGSKRSDVQNTYGTAVAEGLYGRESGGLQGKDDNVRRYWEDQVTRYAARDFVESLVTRKRGTLSRIRVLDLGAGAGEGYEILTSLKKKAGGSLAAKEVEVLPTDTLGGYKGLDISPEMVAQGEQTYADNPKVEFAVADLADGLGEAKADPPYDIYFSSYGSLSHLHDDELQRLIEDVYDHFDGAAIFIADLVGRYSFEWQSFWEEPDGGTKMHEYSMSYLYPPEMRDRAKAQRFPLRYWGGEEFDDFFTRLVESKGGRIARRRIWDRSILVGRHMDTAEFNPRAQPIRAAVNHLHEFDQRTDLESLLFDYSPKRGFPDVNRFFEFFQMAWNTVTHSAIEALERWDDAAWLQEPPADHYPPAVQESIRTIRNVVRNIKWFRMGEPRANVVEPQLGYILRNLEMDLQQGLGASHGLLAVYEIQKT